MALTLKLYQSRALGSLERFLDESRLDGPRYAFENAVDKGLVDEYKPMPGLPDIPYVCLRIPTGGGKTILGAHIIRVCGASYLDRQYPVVMWMVPTTQIKTQTLEAFQNPRHPYRQELDDAFGGQVAVFDVADFAQIRPADLLTKVCVVISTVAALRVDKEEGRKVYEHHEDLEAHFSGASKDLQYLEKGKTGKAVASFANLLKLHGPLIIMDEAHNATTPLSYTVYERLGPKAVVELTATPDVSSSNILVSVSAFELKAENMIKFPIVLKEHNGEWQVAVSSAVARRKSLAQTALGEPEYIRPILLIQAENAKSEATVEEVKRHLIDTDGVDEKVIAVATGTQREIDGIDLFANDCPIEVIITKQALKEGWDCSFAYVFCSVAQVKSDKDIQQLLGRVLRMPYAVPRRQEAMSKAYAHVTTDTFGLAAGELTQSLINIGFNPMEAIAAIRKEKTPELALQGGQIGTPDLPVTKVEVSKSPDFSKIPERDHERVLFVLASDGPGGTIELKDELDLLTVEAIVSTVTGKEKRAAVAAEVERHQQATVAAKAPSERGVLFQVPRLYSVEQGELELVDRGAVSASFTWDLLSSAPDLSSFRFDEASMTFEVYLDDKTVQFQNVKDDVNTYLPGFAQDRTASDLIGWLDQEIREPSIKQPVLREWLRRAVSGLIEDRGFSLSQLLKGQFILRRKLGEQLLLAKKKAYDKGFQQALFEEDMELVTSSEPDHAFTYPADMALYPATSYYAGSFKFKKHYYPFPGMLPWKTSKGDDTEEYLCAQAIELLDEVHIWVRNLVHATQFWMPTATQRTYPDFVARLKDGRLFVIEYKGGDRVSNDDSKEKRLIGELWAKKSEGKGIYLMAQKKDEQGRGLREQLLNAINKAS
ncbi:type III restriction endonuclease subunit R [Pseudomonas sp. MAFF 730085]|uniref:Type III restriction endonuclease subunit R n=1 Tax=Pseudomonas kitaguniensis TaxID=2607908 RepID=A0A5N7JRM4_9PSED|nr:DEAD/DEAH box helicase family protein [Pseudomonas kitaguniensis]MPQ84001.1 type III restriction endonuclease subunit R [Pseudomonas kitaguniensis]